MSDTSTDQRPAAGRTAWRAALLLGLLALSGAALVARAMDLQIRDHEFLQGQGDARHLRLAELPAHRGAIVDRHGEPLAMSAPVDSAWADPAVLASASGRLPALARVLGLNPRRLARELERRSGQSFFYLRRHLEPELARQVRELAIPGVYLRREYRRFYPSGEVAAHLLGFTNIDDRGQEGLELAYDHWLRGEPGAKRVLRDNRGHIVEDVERLRAPQPGRDLALAIDRRLQYLAYRELKAAVQRHRARSGSLVLLDVATGEVLAMVNQPAFNPNDRSQIEARRTRNRAVTDVFEPGSTIKPFTVAAALQSGRYAPHTPVDTSPGVLRVGRERVRDIRDYGRIDVTTVIRKSSNVGAARIALELPEGSVWRQLGGLGFGRSTGSGFPGEAAGHLAAMPPRRPIERATLAFGYGVSATPLQLAQAYGVLAADGLLRPVSLLRRDQAPAGERVLPAATARAVRRMMETVVSQGGTAPMAAVPGYRVAGKTGTVRKPVPGGYAEDRYVAMFAGMAPAAQPRFVMAVIIDEPQGQDYYGGQVAAPVFAAVMAGALRLRDVAPDALPAAPPLVASRGQP